MSYGIFDSVMLEGEQADAYKAKKAKEAKDKEDRDRKNAERIDDRMERIGLPDADEHGKFSEKDRKKALAVMKMGTHFMSKNDMNRPDADYAGAADAAIRHARKQDKKKSTAKTEYANLLIDSYNSKDIY